QHIRYCDAATNRHLTRYALLGTGGTLAQTRTDDRGLGASSPPLVDAPAVGRRQTCARRGAHPLSRSHRLRLQSRRVADVHVRTEKTCTVFGPCRRAAWLHAVGRELRRRCRLVDARRALRLPAAAAGADA